MACAEDVLRDESLWLDGGGPDTQIHATVADVSGGSQTSPALAAAADGELTAGWT